MDHANDIATYALVGIPGGGHHLGIESLRIITTDSEQVQLLLDVPLRPGHVSGVFEYTPE